MGRSKIWRVFGVRNVDSFLCRFEREMSTHFGQKWSMDNPRIYMLEQLDILPDLRRDQEFPRPSEQVQVLGLDGDLEQRLHKVFSQVFQIPVMTTMMIMMFFLTRESQ